MRNPNNLQKIMKTSLLLIAAVGLFAGCASDGDHGHAQTDGTYLFHTANDPRWYAGPRVMGEQPTGTSPFEGYDTMELQDRAYVRERVTPGSSPAPASGTRSANPDTNRR